MDKRMPLLKKGYKPEMIKYVNNIQTSKDFGKRNLMFYFTELPLNENLLCADCIRVLDKRIGE